MSSINGYNVRILSGTLARMAIRLEPITRPGVDGVSFRDTGQRSDPSQIVTDTDLDTDVEANTVIADYHRWVGSLVTVIDEMEVVFNNVAVLGVQILETPRTGTIVGGFGTATTARTLVRAAWLLQVTE